MRCCWSSGWAASSFLLDFSLKGSDLHAMECGISWSLCHLSTLHGSCQSQFLAFFPLQFKETLSTKLLTSTLDILTDSGIWEAEHHVWLCTKISGANLMSWICFTEANIYMFPSLGHMFKWLKENISQDYACWQEKAKVKWKMCHLKFMIWTILIIWLLLNRAMTLT